MNPAVTANGINSGGILRFTSTGRMGGAGNGTYVGSVGRSGAGGGSGEIDVTVNGNVSSSDPNSPGICVLSQGGGSLGGTGYFGAESNHGGGGSYVNVNIGGQITTAGIGASLGSVGGNGGVGVEDTSGLLETIGRNGGNGGGSAYGMNVVVGNIVNSSQVALDALVQGGNGGNGGNAAGSNSSSTGGNGGDGGAAPAVTVMLTPGGEGVSYQTAVRARSIGGAGGSSQVSHNTSTGGNGGQFGSGYRSNEGILRINYLF